MSDLELTISRYLDHDLSGVELETFQELLNESHEAREILQQMELVRSVAREMPKLSVPSAEIENALFQQLFEEEGVVHSSDKERSTFTFLQTISANLSSISNYAERLVPAMILLLVISTGILTEGGEGWVDRPIQSGLSEREPVAAVIESTGTQTSVATANVIQPIPVTPEERVHTSPSATPTVGAATSHQDQSEEGHKSGVQNSTTPSLTPVPYAQNNSAPQPESKSGVPEKLNSNDPDRPMIADIHEEETSTSVPQPSLPALGLLPAPEQRRHSRGNDDGFITASYRHGVAAVDAGNGMSTSQEMNLRLEGNIGGEHRLSVMVGNSPVAIASRREIFVSSTGSPDHKGPSTASSEVIESQRLDNEFWAGAGYGFALVKTGGIQIEAGVNVGAGASAFRYGLELPASFRVADRIRVDVVPYVSRITPYDQELHEVELPRPQNSWTREILEEGRPSALSVGAQIGLSFNIGG